MPVLPPALPGSPPPAGAGNAGLRPLSRAWKWGIALYALAVALGIALALVMSGGPGSGWIAVMVGVLQEPYLQIADTYRGQDDSLPYVEYVVFEGEDQSQQGLTAYLQGRQDVRFQSKGVLPGVSVVRVSREGLETALQELRRQPFVTMVLKSRVGMLCH